jgi:hypothetical protein
MTYFVGNSTANSYLTHNTLEFRSTISAGFGIIKPTSNSTFQNRLDIAPIGGNNAILSGPWWNGLHLAAPLLSYANGSFAFPRTSVYYSYTNSTGPTDMTFNIVAGNDGGLGTAMRLYASGIDFNNRGIDIAANGNVGIGTTSPASKLHVSGSFRLQAPTVPFEWTANAGANDFLKLNAVGYTDNILVINSLGNIGIGTSSPSTKLEVSGGIIKAGTNTSTAGSTILQGIYGAGSLTNIGTEFSSGGPVIGYAVTPSLSATGSFLSSTSINIARNAITLNGAEVRFFQGAIQTVAIGSPVTMSETMRINSFGHVTASNQPYCRVVCSATSITIASGSQVVPFNSALNNVGSHFNTSTFRFTLPVTGKYLVTASIQTNGVTAQYYNLYLRLNGSGIFGTFQTGSGVSYQQFSTTGVISGNASDYIDVALFAVTGGGTLETSASDSRCALSITLLS